jgi:hypothetical protein
VRSQNKKRRVFTFILPTVNQNFGEKVRKKNFSTFFIDESTATHQKSEFEDDDDDEGSQRRVRKSKQKSPKKIVDYTKQVQTVVSILFV